MTTRKSTIDRFWDKVHISESCWTWTAYRDANGYGKFGHISYSTMLAHRFSWIVHFGVIPNGLFVCHSCDNPPCVRPDHLFLGTAVDNNRDRELKHRGGAKKRQGMRNGRNRLATTDVIHIRELAAIGFTHGQLGIMYNVSQPHVTDIVNRRRGCWRHLSMTEFERLNRRYEP